MTAAAQQPPREPPRPPTNGLIKELRQGQKPQCVPGRRRVEHDASEMAVRRVPQELHHLRHSSTRQRKQCSASDMLMHGSSDCTTCSSNCTTCSRAARQHRQWSVHDHWNCFHKPLAACIWQACSTDCMLSLRVLCRLWRPACVRYLKDRMAAACPQRLPLTPPQPRPPPAGACPAAPPG